MLCAPSNPQRLHFSAPVSLSLATFSIYRPQSREDELMAELIRASILDHGASICDFFAAAAAFSDRAAPNGLGTLFGLVQLILYAIFYKSTERQRMERQGKGEIGLGGKYKSISRLAQQD
ncbi:hypothetical protein Acr_00g0055390 [Actinidia rufa]|uniref:Uncharacterized protein n=1 Tax=Actinidia rufa TaxID=165716 RepID=A0A7J0DLW4_9ERIC|nr:hypothetical protein Acr_00g0055390 [Actinidia rufa]